MCLFGLRLWAQVFLAMAIALCISLFVHLNSMLVRSLKADVSADSFWSGITPQSKIHTCCVRGDRVEIPTQPAWIIIGAQKSATTTLFRYLIQHPNVLPPRNWVEEGSEEVHFFDFRIPTERRPEFKTTDEFFCFVRKTYLEQYFYKDALLDAARNGTNLVSFEKTPNYLQDLLVPGYIKKTCPWLRKLIAVIRNPVDRAYSHYNMDMHVRGEPSDPVQFERSVLIEIGNMTTAGLVEWSSASGSFVPSTLSSEEEVGAFVRLPKKPQYVRRGLYDIQLREWSKTFNIPDELLIVNYDDLRDDGARAVFERVLDHVGLPSYNLSEGYGIHNSRPYAEPMLNRTRKLLRQFYEPFNVRLRLLLGQEWRDDWSH